MRSRTLPTLAIALLLASPLAAAAWRGQGYYEPDTARDTEGFMFLDPSTEPGARNVYFSAFPAQYGYAARGGPNPNSAALGSSFMWYPTDVHAILGVWRDCNQDGYVGVAEGVLLDYRAELLTETDVCPPTPAFPLAAADPNFVPAHNDGQWVRELITIGPDVAGGNTARTNPYNLDDPAARVWADWGQPEYGSNPTCISLPVSNGNFRSTGGFLRWADCIASYRITGTVNTVAHTTGLTDLAFDDAPREYPDQSGSMLNRPNPWGTESDRSVVTAFDCSQPISHHDDSGMTHVSIQDPTGGQLSGPKQVEGVGTVTLFGADGRRNVANATDENYDLFLMGSPTAPSVDPTGSPAGTLNETNEATTAMGSCDREDDAGGSTDGEIYEEIENSQEGTPPSGRTSSDIWFEFAEGANECAQPNQPAACTPGQAGLGLMRTEQVTGRSGAAWYGLPGYVVSRNPYVNRDSLQVWGAVWLTAYAKVGLPSVGVPGQTALYGADHCSGTTPTTGAWVCDGARWYVDSSGNKITAPHGDWQVLPGTAYQLRDIDCYDGAPFAGSPVTLSDVGNDRCVRP